MAAALLATLLAPCGMYGGNAFLGLSSPDKGSRRLGAYSLNWSRGDNLSFIISIRFP